MYSFFGGRRGVEPAVKKNQQRLVIFGMFLGIILPEGQQLFTADLVGFKNAGAVF